jgi:hypothetical protein
MCILVGIVVCVHREHVQGDFLYLSLVKLVISQEFQAMIKKIFQ